MWPQPCYLVSNENFPSVLPKEKFPEYDGRYAVPMRILEETSPIVYGGGGCNVRDPKLEWYSASSRHEGWKDRMEQKTNETYSIEIIEVHRGGFQHLSESIQERIMIDTLPTEYLEKSLEEMVKDFRNFHDMLLCEVAMYNTNERHTVWNEKEGFPIGVNDRSPAKKELLRLYGNDVPFSIKNQKRCVLVTNYKNPF